VRIEQKACGDGGTCARDNTISSIVYIHYFARVISMNSICAIKHHHQKQAGTPKNLESISNL
jgi:hypothetical protein